MRVTLTAKDPQLTERNNKISVIQLIQSLPRPLLVQKAIKVTPFDVTPNEQPTRRRSSAPCKKDNKRGWLPTIMALLLLLLRDDDNIFLLGRNANFEWHICMLCSGRIMCPGFEKCNAKKNLHLSRRLQTRQGGKVNILAVASARADKTETMAGAIVSMEVVTFEQWMPPVLQSIKSQKEHAISFAQTARRTRDAICITFKADGAQARSQDKVHWNHAAEMFSFIFVFLVDSNWIL